MPKLLNINTPMSGNISNLKKINWVYSYHDVDKYYEETDEEKNERRVSELMKEFDENPSLLSQLTVELRKRKIQKIKEIKK